MDSRAENKRPAGSQLVFQTAGWLPIIAGLDIPPLGGLRSATLLGPPSHVAWRVSRHQTAPPSPANPPNAAATIAGLLSAAVSPPLNNLRDGNMGRRRDQCPGAPLAAVRAGGAEDLLLHDAAPEHLRSCKAQEGGAPERQIHGG